MLLSLIIKPGVEATIGAEHAALKETLDRTVKFFEAKGIVNPVDTEYLFHHALEFLNRVDLYVNFEKIMSKEELDQLRPLIQRRGKGEPVAHITGVRGFYGRDFKVTPDVLIPRPETELVVDEVLDREKAGQLPEDLSILDLGCGSGCIGLSLACGLPRAKVVLVEKSESAMAVAKENAQRLGVEQRVEFILSDVEKLELQNKFDIVVANPPYIGVDDEGVMPEVRNSEPHQALFSGDNGFLAPEAWLKKSREFVGESFLMVFEIGWNQGSRLSDEAKKTFKDAQVRVKKDYNQLDRLLICDQTSGTEQHG
ncbi:MAG: peptide chain release factor N(5)-glutamine methyltransferase [Bdellovibrionales bacterium]